ncbi:MAG: hypothetical protein IJJ70_09595 [Treponema sp.]|nr:hypothetical protein [Treponema sp.]MBR0487936.1 hypothetical protein [Treponema sp.]
MKKSLALACALLTLGAAAFCQEEPEQNDEKFAVNYTLNEPGDQYINIGLMVTFPMNFGGNFPLFRSGQMQTGGAGTLGYHRFLTSWFDLGIDVTFGYNPTLGENIFTYVPFVLSATFQPNFRHFEFPLTMGIGVASESYLNRTYFPGLVLKPQAGVFYRATPSWSFGVRYDFMYMPQWYDDPSKNDYGLFSSAMISARYHF